MINNTLITSLFPKNYNSRGYIYCDGLWYDYVNGVKIAAGTKTYPYYAQNNLPYTFTVSAATLVTTFTGVKTKFCIALDGTSSYSAIAATPLDNCRFAISNSKSGLNSYITYTCDPACLLNVKDFGGGVFQVNNYPVGSTYNGGTIYDNAYSLWAGFSTRLGCILHVITACTGNANDLGYGAKIVEVDTCFIKVKCIVSGVCTFNLGQGYILEGAAEPATGKYWTSSKDLSNFYPTYTAGVSIPFTYTFVSNQGWMRRFSPSLTSTGFVCSGQWFLPDYGGCFMAKCVGTAAEYFYKSLSTKNKIYRNVGGTSTNSANYILHENPNCQIMDFAIYGVAAATGIHWIDQNNILYNYNIMVQRNLTGITLIPGVYKFLKDSSYQCEGYDSRYIYGTSNSNLTTIGYVRSIYVNY